MEADDYMLASAAECERLERQGEMHGRDRPLTHIRLKPGQRFLDAGCGSGWVGRVVARAFPDAEIVGVDLNPGYVEFARRKAEAEGLMNTTYAVADLQSLPFDAASFDVVWSQFVLYFVPDPQKVVDEFARVTRPGGTVLSAVHHLPALNDPPFEDQDLLTRYSRTVLRGWRSEALPGMFHSVGLVDVDIAIERDRIYGKLPGAPLDDGHRLNYETIFAATIDRVADGLGGRERVRQMQQNWLAYLARPETTAIAGYWVASGTAPG